MRTVSKIFLTGLATILPVAATVYVLWWLGTSIQGLLDPMVAKLPVGARDFPFIGVALAVGVVFLIGLLMQLWLVRIVFGWAEKLLVRLPLVKTLYGSVQDLMSFFGKGDDDRKQSQPVVVRFGSDDVRLIGLVTRDDFSDLPDGIGTSETVAVYLPMSYQIGGFTAMVPRTAIQPIPMSTEEAIRFAVTAGVARGTESKDKPAPAR